MLGWWKLGLARAESLIETEKEKSKFALWRKIRRIKRSQPTGIKKISAGDVEIGKMKGNDDKGAFKHLPPPLRMYY